MADLTTKYMGLTLKNPIIIGACNLVTDVNNLKRMEQAGAAAIVYKSLFEEQIQLETLELEDALEEYNERNAEMTRIFPDMEHAGPKQHLLNLRKAKAAVNIPIIASINAVYDLSWVDYAKQVEETGVDALELNFYHVPEDFTMEGKTIIELQTRILKEVKSHLKIPVAVKLSPYYTNILKTIADMDKLGANGFVLFNRLFQPEINIEKEELQFPWNLSAEGDSKLALRFAALLYGNISADICANTGILNGKHVIQMLLAGANTVQVVSALYKNKIDVISEMLIDVQQWMESKKYKTISDFRGKLAKKNVADTFAYSRAQYVDILWNSKNIFEKYPLL